MAVEKVNKQSGCSLSHIIECKKTQPFTNNTITREHTAPTINIL